MPLYEYRCKACGHRFEKIQTYSAPDEKECPVCKGEVERLISAPSIQFKGSGFYSTDYPSRASKSAAAEGKSEAGDGGSAKVVEGGSSSSSDKGGSSSDKSGSSDKSSSSGDKSSSPTSGASSSPPPAAPSSSSSKD